jgi:hypothetical protein
MTKKEKIEIKFQSVAHALESRSNASIDRIDSGDILTRIPYTRTLEVLRCWEAQLRDGGELRIDVGDFDAAVKMYQDGSGDCEPLLCGPDGLAKAIFNREKICDLLNMAGFEIVGGGDGSLKWNETPGRLCVLARKRTRPVPPMLPERLPIHAIMSLPRIAWTDTFAHTLDAISRLQLNFTKSTGVFWGQCLQRLMETVIRKGEAKYILTIDYDSIFDARDIIRLWQIMESNPDIAALCPLQIGRDRDGVLLSLITADGKDRKSVMSTELYEEAVDLKTGHFGLTLIRCDAIDKIPKPWFLGIPNKEGRWEDDRIDDDIYFWHKVREHGGRVAVCPKVRIGHLQCVISWPMDDLSVRHQYLSKYHDDGRPQECSTY